MVDASCQNKDGPLGVSKRQDPKQRGVCYTGFSIYESITKTAYPNSVPRETGKRRLRGGGHALVSGCPEHWTI